MKDRDLKARRWGQWGGSESVALIAGPALGGFLLFGSLLPSPLFGGLLGAMIGAAAGMLRNRELAKISR
jgi:hypothetical protein